MKRTILRGSLYVAIAILSHLLGNAKEGMSSFEVLMLAGGSILTGMITLRAFIDRTPSEEAAERHADRADQYQHSEP